MKGSEITLISSGTLDQDHPLNFSFDDPYSSTKDPFKNEGLLTMSVTTVTWKMGKDVVYTYMTVSMLSVENTPFFVFLPLVYVIITVLSFYIC